MHTTNLLTELRSFFTDNTKELLFFDLNTVGDVLFHKDGHQEEVPTLNRHQHQHQGHI